MVDLDLNWWAIAFGVVLYMVVGFVWYAPAVFGNYWMKLMGKRAKELKGAGPGYALAVVAAVVQTFILALLVEFLGATTASDGAALGLLFWLGSAATVSITQNVFSGLSWPLWAINQGYALVVMMANGAVLAVWQ